MVSRLPPHLQGERALAEYFENMNLSVESVNVCRDVATLKYLLDERTKALLLLEKTWVKYVGNPSTFHHNDAIQPLIDVEQSSSDVQAGRLINPNKKRPTVRPGWFSAKVDAIEHHEKRFQEADDKVKQWRRSGKFKSSHTAFVTFEKMSSAVRALTSSEYLSYSMISKSPYKRRMHLIQINASLWRPLNHATLFGGTCLYRSDHLPPVN